MSLIIYPPKTPIVGHILDCPIRYYGLIMGICFIIGVLIAYLVFAKTINKEEAEKFFDYSPFAILFSLIGARLFYVFGSYEYYFSGNG